MNFNLRIATSERIAVIILYNCNWKDCSNKEVATPASNLNRVDQKPTQNQSKLDHFLKRTLNSYLFNSEAIEISI